MIIFDSSVNKTRKNTENLSEDDVLSINPCDTVVWNTVTRIQRRQCCYLATTNTVISNCVSQLIPQIDLSSFLCNATSFLNHCGLTSLIIFEVIVLIYSPLSWFPIDKRLDIHFYWWTYKYVIWKYQWRYYVFINFFIIYGVHSVKFIQSW